MARVTQKHNLELINPSLAKELTVKGDGAKYMVESYKTTWRKLAKYASSRINEDA